MVACFLVLSVGCASSAGGFLSDVGSGVFVWRSLFRKLFLFLAIVGVFFGLGAAFSVKVWRRCLRQWLSLSRCLLTWKIFFFPHCRPVKGVLFVSDVVPIRFFIGLSLGACIHRYFSVSRVLSLLFLFLCLKLHLVPAILEVVLLLP